MRLSGKPMEFTGLEKPRVITLTSMCNVKGCYQDIAPGVEFVESNGYRAHLVCAAKEIVKNATSSSNTYRRGNRKR